MTPEDLRYYLKQLDLTLEDAARVLLVEDETAIAWATGEEEIPEAVAIALVLMDEFKVDPWRFGYSNPGD